MATKEEILAAISSALDIMGLGGTGPDDYGEQAETNEVPTWGKMDVSVPDAGRGPIHDRAALFQNSTQGLFDSDKMSKPPQVGNFTTDAYGMPLPQDQEEGMSMMGIL